MPRTDAAGSRVNGATGTAALLWFFSLGGEDLTSSVARWDSLFVGGSW